MVDKVGRCSGLLSRSTVDQVRSPFLSLWFTMHRALVSFSHLLLSLLLRAHAAAPLPSLPIPLLRTAVPGRRRRQPNRHPGDFDEQLSDTRALHEHGGGTGEVNRVAWCPQLWFRGGVA
jgi:hypothetical protein